MLGEEGLKFSKIAAGDSLADQEVRPDSPISPGPLSFVHSKVTDVYCRPSMST